MRFISTKTLYSAAIAIVFLFGRSCNFVSAEMIGLEVYKREPFAEGKAFGDTGPYEKIVGIARFEVDPFHPRNKDIVDLPLAPRNIRGKVEFESDVFILAPKDPARGNGAIFYDVNNRGNKLALRFFNYGTGSNDPTTAADAGDGFLFRRGNIVVWGGWISELLPGSNRLLLRAPVAHEGAQPLRGVVRFEMVTDAPTATLPLSRREGHGSYNPTAKGERDAILTMRRLETDAREAIPSSKWSLERQPIARTNQGVSGTLGQIRLRLEGGFQPGAIYELICECEGPIVQGLGFAAVRDLISFLRFNQKDSFRVGGVKRNLTRAYGFGVSQSGRFLRNFLYLGFNVDEANRKVFDGLIPHVAGGGLGFFNHRFAQPTRHNGQHEEHLYPGDYFPFTYGLSEDWCTTKEGILLHGKQAEDGILRRLNEENSRFVPKVMHTQSAAEYWHRSGSLVHTETDGRDAEVPETVRIYAFGGTQHGPASYPPNRGIGDNLLNPGDYKPFLRALLDALDGWVDKDLQPPQSIYPRVDKGTLVAWDQKSTGFPKIPGVRYPRVIQQPPCLNFGSKFYKTGRIDNEPPTIRGYYPVSVPKSGSDGNDMGTLLPPEVAVPLATYTGWNLRRAEAGADGALYSLSGSYIPFAKTVDQRKASGDPRASIEERYGSFSEYQKEFTSVCRDLVKQRLLLGEDARRLVDSREKVRHLFPNEGK